MEFSCTVRRLAHGRWRVRHSGAAVGAVEVTASGRDAALEKLRNELQFRIELCPCSGASADRAELVVREDD